MRIKKGVVFPLRPLIVGKILSRLVLALFGPDAPDRRCPLIGEKWKFAARCQSDAIDSTRTSAACGLGRAAEMTAVGTSRHFAALRNLVAAGA
jgi:hypothetical protein